MSKLVVQWRHTHNGHPYVRLQREDDARRFVHVMLRFRFDTKHGVEHTFWRVFPSRFVLVTTSALKRNDFGNLEAAWTFARKVLS